MVLTSIYDQEAVAPMWQELAAVGVDPLTTPEQVDEVLGRASGTLLVIVNSICGCAAGSARPGAMLALQHAVIPDRYVTVFAGVDRDAVNRARDYMVGYPPSSPSIALFKDGRQVFMLERSELQQMMDDQVAAALRKASTSTARRPGLRSIPRSSDSSSRTGPADRRFRWWNRPPRSARAYCAP